MELSVHVQGISAVGRTRAPAGKESGAMPTGAAQGATEECAGWASGVTTRPGSGPGGLGACLGAVLTVGLGSDFGSRATTDAGSSTMVGSSDASEAGTGLASGSVMDATPSVLLEGAVKLGGRGRTET